MAGIGKRVVLGAAAALGFVLVSAPAAAQATRTWISGVGDDVNPCSRTAPCKTFQGAIAKTAAGGEINCLDSGGFGSLTITKSISIVCDTVESGVLVAATNGFIINGSNVVVLLSGLDFEGLGQTGSAGINGINILNAGTVRVSNVKIRGFRNGFGILAQPQSGPLTLIVENTEISESGVSGNQLSGGIGLLPATNTSVTALLTDTHIVNNLNSGIRIEATGTTGTTVSLKVRNSQIDGNGGGIAVKAPANTGIVKVMVTDSSISLNTTTGVAVNGAGVTGRVGNTSITGNALGVGATNSAVLSSYGNNQLDGNTTDGSFSGTIAPK